MQRERTGPARRTADARAGERTGRTRRTAVAVGVVGSLVGVPAALVVAMETGALAAVVASGYLWLGLVVMAPGLLLGALSLVVMLGS